MTEAYPALYLYKVERRFREAATTLDILKGADLAVWAGQSVALIAPSGTGKSTLLQLAGLLEKPDAGEVYVNERPTVSLPDDERTAIRRNDIGFVYQSHHLLPEFTGLENVMLPQLIRGLGRAEATERAKGLLTYLGLGERLTHRPSELSGGEQQRVAIARAIAKRPEVLLCDEPTGALDVTTGIAVLEAIERINRELGTLTVIITHNAVIAEMSDRVLHLSDGKIINIETNRTRLPASQLKW